VFKDSFKFFDKYLTNPKSIDLSDNKLGSAVAKVLEEVLPRYKWLTKLFLINTNFTVEEQESIRKAADRYTDIVF
jgi:Ran GTPase-activating protein (RanGAP) involved in mRNA processing and transport